MSLTSFENKVRNTFTLDKQVDEDLKKFIKPRERSEFINDLIKEGIKEERKKKLLNILDNLN
jgi:metal-responsive CopG/Arc/MetJ family transcriptional regulator